MKYLRNEDELERRDSKNRKTEKIEKITMSEETPQVQLIQDRHMFMMKKRQMTEP